MAMLQCLNEALPYEQFKYEFQSEIQEALQWSELAYKTQYTPCVHLITKDTCQVVIANQRCRTVVAIACWQPFVYKHQMASFMDGHVHAHILAMHNSILSDIRNALCPVRVQRNVMVCGHGVGGALACLCAADLSWDYTVSCITFAAIPFASGRFQKIFRNILPHALNVCNIFDPFCYFPWKCKHGPRVKWIARAACDCHAIKCYSAPAYPQCSTWSSPT